MVLITIVTGGYKPTYNIWGPHIVPINTLKLPQFFPRFLAPRLASLHDGETLAEEQLRVSQTV